MADREFLMVVKESALNVPMTTPVAGTDSIYCRLIDSNSFGMWAKPLIEDIPYGGGLAITGESISDHYECAGQLRTKLYPSQASMLMNWAVTRINTAQTAPWTTTEPPGDLASCSVYHAVMRADGTFKRHLFSGCKVTGWRTEVSRGSTTAMLTLDLMASKSQGNAGDATADPDATVFPAPGVTDYPSGPYTFHQTAGGLTIGSVRTQYEDLALAGTNVIDGRWFEQRYRQILQFCGRSTTLETTLYLKATPDDRSAYEALTANAASVVFTNGVIGQNMTINYHGQNTISDLPYDLPLNEVFKQKITLRNRFDPAVLSDIDVLFA